MELVIEVYFRKFSKGMLDRLIQGQARYGTELTPRKRYLTRLVKELGRYEDTGNAEHLYNIANYALLEHTAPEHPKYHYDPNAPSATRGKIS